MNINVKNGFQNNRVDQNSKIMDYMNLLTGNQVQKIDPNTEFSLIQRSNTAINEDEGNHDSSNS